MVYDWEAHKDTISRLYVDEDKQVDEILEFMRTHHNFCPSKRAYATQFRRWSLPSKHQPALKNDALVARVRQLWERNLSQTDMLELLHDEGFSIKSRELHRVRSANRWLLRTPPSAARAVHGPEGKGTGKLHASEKETAPATKASSTTKLKHVADGQNALSKGEEDNLLYQVVAERRLQMETESASRLAARKRRRRTRQYAGMPADPPGPPRFPSETTLSESQVILALDKAAYIAVREKFEALCKAAGIIKKTVAGPDSWDRAKHELVAAFPHLQGVVWLDKNGAARKMLALDVICSDVTKRMRAGAEKGLVLAEAKNILGLNPTESRQLRATFYELLKREGPTSKVVLGPERWKELKQQWVDESDVLCKILSRLDDMGSHDTKTKAVEALATDAIKRWRDDQSKDRSARQDKAKAAATAASLKGVHFDEGPAGLGPQALQQNSSAFPNGLLVSDSNRQTHVEFHPPRILPNHHLLDQEQVAIQMPMNMTQFGTHQLFTGSDAHGAFMTSHQPFMQQTAPSVSPVATAFDTSQTASAFRMPATIPIYLRQLGPGSMEPVGETWIAFLSSHSLSFDELRHVAAQKVPGSTCVEVIGLLQMDNMGGSCIPLQIESDGQLSAHLAQGGPHMFSVRLSF